MSEGNDFGDIFTSVESRNRGCDQFAATVREVLEDVERWSAAHDRRWDLQTIARLVEPERSVSFRVVWEDDEGQHHVERAWRVQFSGVLGPHKGGLRFSRHVNRDTLLFLSFEQTFKNALTGLTLGSAKGGSTFDPHGRSPNEVRRFCSAFMEGLWRSIGSTFDVPAGDIGVGEREIGYLYGAYRRLAQRWDGALTGKGPSWGGSLLRREATGWGVAYISQAALAERGDALEGKRCLVSGAGNVALHCAERLAELGARVVTVSNSSGLLVDEAGLSREKIDYIRSHSSRSVLADFAEKFKGSEFHPGKKPWGVAGDFAFPCATQNELTRDDAEDLLNNGISMVTAGANGPLTSEAVHRIRETDVLYLPGKAANAGGVAVSAFEMSQNRSLENWSREDVDNRLRDTMNHILRQCRSFGETEHGVDFALGANVAGFTRVYDAMLAQGS